MPDPFMLSQCWHRYRGCGGLAPRPLAAERRTGPHNLDARSHMSGDQVVRILASRRHAQQGFAAGREYAQSLDRSLC